MSDAKKTKEQLTNELMELRKRVDGLENENAERRKKEHALQLTQFAVDRAADAIFWMGPDARFFYVNDEACRSLGYSREELLSMTVHDIDPNFPEEVWPAHWEQIKQRGSFTIESSHRNRDGRTFPVEVMVNYLSFNSIEYNCVFARNITKRKKNEEELIRSEERYRSFVQHFQGIAYKGNMDFTPIFFHGSVEEMTGYTEEDFVNGKPRWDQVIHPDDLPGLKESFEDIRLVPDHSDVREYRIICKDGQTRWIRDRIKNVSDNSGKPALVQGTIQDITERKQAEEELKKFKFISDNANDAHFLVDRDAKFLYVNETACRMLGYSEEELLTLGVPDVDIVYGAEKFRELFDLIQKEKVPPLQTVNKRRDETVFCSEISVTGYQIDGEPYMFAVLRDITERKAIQEQIIKALKEKETLLKEIHHRVKNNMAVVSSLLRLQSSRVKDEHYRAMFNDSISRIKTMSLIHEKLYQSEDLSQIIFSDYIKDMVNNVYKSYRPGSRIKLVTDIEKITLGIDISTPCGLIVNELITNSMKYAFPATVDRPEGREGEIRVSLHMNDKEEVKLVISDNGVGMPEELDFRNPDSLGLILVNALVRQLNGKIELSRDKGTEFMIIFNG